MRDIDKVQEYEARQQKLVTDIVDELHRQTVNTKDYRKTFGTLAVLLLQFLTNKQFSTKDKFILRLWGDQIWEPVQKFLGHSKPHELFMAERYYLMHKIFEEVLTSVSTGIVGNYQRAELAHPAL